MTGPGKFYYFATLVTMEAFKQVPLSLMPNMKFFSEMGETVDIHQRVMSTRQDGTEDSIFHV